MKHVLLPSIFRLALAVLALTFVCCDATEDPDAAPGLPPCGLDDASIPDFTLVDGIEASLTYGKEVSLSDYSGKVVMIFWMTAT